MKKGQTILLIFLLLLTAGGCAAKDAAGSNENNANAASDANTPAAKVWTAEKVEKLFTADDKNAKWLIKDCVAADDRAYERVGVVLFTDSANEVANVAFIDAEGYYQYCGIDAAVPEESELTYVGDGAVTLKLIDPEIGEYTCKVTFSAEGSNVNFKAENIDQ